MSVTSAAQNSRQTGFMEKTRTISAVITASRPLGEGLGSTARQGGARTVEQNLSPTSIQRPSFVKTNEKNPHLKPSEDLNRSCYFFSSSQNVLPFSISLRTSNAT